MTLKELTTLLQNPTNISEEIIFEIEQTAVKHPYFQLAQMLLAKAHYNINSSQKDHYLFKAAIYTPDRNKLYQFVSENKVTASAVIEDNNYLKIINEEKAVVEPIEIRVTGQEAPHSIDEIIKDDFEYNPNLVSFDTKSNLNDNEIDNWLEENQKAEKNRGAKKRHKKSYSDAKSEDFIFNYTGGNYLDMLNLTEEIENSELDELSKNNNQNKPSNNLIDQFLSNDVKIKPKLEEETEKKDLAVDSISEDNELVSESLAKIYINQNLYSKAIDIYKALILKYPKKSAYFASQIQDIEKLT
ncbi:MAG: hypothetical protein JXA53_02305 [Bacteroidales bacterium]|nr:hypothetical protein [Bacteroidales bacterium]